MALPLVLRAVLLGDVSKMSLPASLVHLWLQQTQVTGACEEDRLPTPQSAGHEEESAFPRHDSFLTLFPHELRVLRHDRPLPSCP